MCIFISFSVNIIIQVYFQLYLFIIHYLVLVLIYFISC